MTCGLYLFFLILRTKSQKYKCAICLPIKKRKKIESFEKKSFLYDHQNPLELMQIM